MYSTYWCCIFPLKWIPEYSKSYFNILFHNNQALLALHTNLNSTFKASLCFSALVTNILKWYKIVSSQNSYCEARSLVFFKPFIRYMPTDLYNWGAPPCLWCIGVGMPTLIKGMANTVSPLAWCILLLTPHTSIILRLSGNIKRMESCYTCLIA